ncbi:hypothetical protein D8826_08855 [Streptococcus intermedius]|nr:hypothetical protein D8826_08855 [Streptococcus intermedius]
MELIQTLKKLFGILLLMFLFLENIVYAQDGELNMKTDSITQRRQHSSGNEIEHQYAPNLFIDRTEQQAAKERSDVKKLIVSANSINFNENGIQNRNKDTMQAYQQLLFQNYTVSDNIIVDKDKSEAVNIWGRAGEILFIVMMAVLGVHLGRKFHGIRIFKRDY